MTLVVSEMTPDDRPAWDEFVAAHPLGTHAHQSGWAPVIERAFRQRATYRIARRGTQIEGVLPLIAFANPIFGRYLVSVPYLNRGGILAQTNEARDALLEDAGSLVSSTSSKFCELRHVESLEGLDLPVRDVKVSMSLPVDRDQEAIWKDVGAKVRNLVRKAEKGGLKVREVTAEEGLAPFYALFAENMRDLGTPVYSRRFFGETLREFGDQARLTLVEGDEGPAAAGICLMHGGVSEINWAASSRVQRKHSPNMLLYWDAIAHAAGANLREFCFGRSTEGSGPYRFKKQWGAQPTRLHWEYVLAPGQDVPGLNPDNPKFRAAVAVWKRLPIPVTRILGPGIVRHIP